MIYTRMLTMLKLVVTSESTESEDEENFRSLFSRSSGDHQIWFKFPSKACQTVSTYSIIKQIE
jgi:hypothetical protein